ncbi:MAG: hypothetical protein U0992_06615 [Planctomycetaceae bacterium]
MKRLIASATLLLVTGLVFVVADDIRTRPVLLADEAASAPAQFIVDSVRPQSSPALDALREQYVEQQRAKAALMSDEELKSALGETAKEVRELEAKKHVQQISEALAAVVKKYEGTHAAAVAEQMLRTYHDGGNSGGNAPYYPTTPTPLPSY